MKVLTILGVIALLLLTSGIALAWPEQPPDKATISGAGLAGEVQVTDRESLEVLRLGTIEDFSRGTIAAPTVGEGYTITRYFYGATFNFARLHYYPNAAGGSGYVFFEDGPDIQGDHTRYNGKWLYASPQGEAALRRLLAKLGAPVAVAAQTAAGSIPETQPQESNLSPETVGWLALVSVLLGSIGLGIWRRRQYALHR